MKIWIIVGIGLILSGLIIFTVVMSFNHWDFTRLSTVKYVDNTYTLNEDFSKISIETNTANISFVPSDSDVCQVICHEPENRQHQVLVEYGCLTVQMKNQQHWYDAIGINFGTSKITVALPRKAYESLVVKGSTGHVDVPGDYGFQNIDIMTSTGNVTIRDMIAGNVSVRVSTGRVSLTNLSCDTLSSIGNTGDTVLKNVLVTWDLSLMRSTGDIRLTNCDAENLYITTGTGDVTGTLLTNKVFSAQTSTGKIKVPKTTTGGICQVTTSTGNITFEITNV